MLSASGNHSGATRPEARPPLCRFVGAGPVAGLLEHLGGRTALVSGRVAGGSGRGQPRCAAGRGTDRPHPPRLQSGARVDVDEVGSAHWAVDAERYD